MTTTYEISVAGGRWTVLARDQYGEAFDLNAKGEPCLGWADLRGFVVELHRVGTFGADVRDALLREVDGEIAREAERAASRSPSPLQIMALRDEAATAGDREQVAICERALAGDAAAWDECTRVIRAARDMET